MKFLSLLLIICLTHFGYSQKSLLKDSTIKKEVVSQNDSSIKTSKTIIELEDAKTIFKEKKNDFWDKYSSGLIAAVTVLASLGISVWQARKSQRYTKANIISEARIEWIQKLRPHLGELISNISIFSDSFRDFKDNYVDPKTNKQRILRTNEEKQEGKTVLDELTSRVHKITETFNQVKLFLNREETEHIHFINLVDDFTTDFLELENIDTLEDDLIIGAQIILKNAWVQAKFGDKKNRKKWFKKRIKF